MLYRLAVFIAGGLLQWVEYRATPESVRQRLNCPPEGCMSFFEALYFMIVTVSINQPFLMQHHLPILNQLDFDGV